MTYKEIADRMTPAQRERFVTQFAIQFYAFLCVLLVAVGAIGFAIYRLITQEVGQ